MDEEDYLQLSGLQHYAFCSRQWALIHLEAQWHENVRTIEGEQLHERVHDVDQREKRGRLLTIRGMSIKSRALGVSGQCDAVEFHQDPTGIKLNGEDGTWLPVPVEYKRGQPKTNDADRLQLCCQAMCLEEMLACPPIPVGYLYYGQTAHRERVELTPELREKVEQDLAQMHQLMKRGYTPKVKLTKSCNACSLREECLPQMNGRPSVYEYIHHYLKEDENAQAE